MSGNLHSDYQMDSSEDGKFIAVDKLNAKNFIFNKSKLEMVLATEDLWEIMDNLELLTPFTSNDNNKKAYEQWCKKIFTIFVMSLVDKVLAHVKGCKGLQKIFLSIMQHTQNHNSCPTSCSEGASSS